MGPSGPAFGRPDDKLRATRERHSRRHSGVPIARPRRGGRFIRATARRLQRTCAQIGFAAGPFFTAAALSVAAEAQNPDLAVSGFAVAPPAGYVAAPGAPLSPLQVTVRLTKPAEPDTSCDVSFEVLPGFEHFSQDALNRQTDNPNWDLFYRDGLGDFYTVMSVERFDHTGVRGAVVLGISKPRPAIRSWAADLPTLIFMFYTPKGLSKIACVAPEAVFKARRDEFEAVARGVTLAR
jgi:hypothetical protein